MTIDQASSTLLDSIRDLGYRVTSTRRQVALAMERRSEGFSAEEISSDLPQVGRATVYRALKLFQNAGVICKLALPNGVPRYTIATGGRHHHHSVCVRCGAVTEFRDSTVERVVRTLSSEIEGEMVGHRIEFFVTCPTCLSAVALSQSRAN